MVLASDENLGLIQMQSYVGAIVRIGVPRWHMQLKERRGPRRLGAPMSARHARFYERKKSRRTL